MRLSFLLVSCMVLCYSCGNPSNGTEKLSGSDSLVVTFNYPNTDSVMKTVSTTGAGAIKKLKGFLGGRKTEQFKCGYDGNLIFYKEGKELLPVIFKYSEDGCQHFLFDADGTTTSVAMNKEAVSFFKSLLEGKAWY